MSHPLRPLEVAGAALVLAFSTIGCTHPHGHGAHHDATVHHRFEDAERWAKEFEDPERDAWQKPDAVIDALQIPPNARVADIGSATGYFAVRIARRYPDAIVYGADVEPSMTEYLNARAQREGLANVRAITAAPDDPKLPEPVDLVLVVDTFHHLDARPAYFRHLREHALRPGGRVAIVDFKKGASRGPPGKHKLDPEQVIAELSQAGFELDAQPDLLPDQYVLIFKVKAQ